MKHPAGGGAAHLLTSTSFKPVQYDFCMDIKVGGQVSG